MKVKIIDDRIFTAYLLNGNGAPKLEVHQKDGAKPPAVLGPNDFIPGLEPRGGLTAVQLLIGVGGFLHAEKLNQLKPAVRGAVEKFMKSPTKTPEQKAESELKNEIESVAIELNEAAAVLDLVMSSEMMIGFGGDAESFEQLRHALCHLAPVFIEKARKLYGLTTNHR